MVERVVVVGAGLGGVRTAEQLRNQGYRGRISLVGAEPHAPYDRPPLSKQILTGAWTPERIVLKDADALTGLDVDTYLGVPAAGLRTGAVELADGTTLPADAVVIATGADARRLPGQPEAVHTLRTLDDALALRSALGKASSLLVVGAGFIGAEVASAARDQGLDVTVLEAGPVPCERALGPEVGVLCARLLREAGADLRLGTKMTGFVDAHTVRLADGSEVSADVVLVGIGAAPRLDWLSTNPDLDVSNGLACDTTGRVLGTTGVWAVGDVAAWEDPGHGGRFRYEHWTSVTDQATVVARDILGGEQTAPAVPYFWSDQFGLKIQMAGRPQLAGTVQPLQGEGLSGGPVKGTVVGYFAGDRFVAVAGFGAAKHVAKYRMLLVKGAEKSEVLAA
ncbi:FAD-dependent oxidoreductase [Amycolatopsis endophytica]|uniref:NADPH-dependent 2,4-dienoyl-CoA reductase/sulfur reductase-like enzyme n=1 Tax=Amycolatopsis endophytica TaxID=860233 RepID=A0A853B3A1_9PSEU|nr:FAD-dependent oxidoreductase [Amycolatopsis endophytica]NYI89499.1 NADPH-dependent 2,4-dienoyl-CoA reductase/sulfur reductase-like enzyme [Amycolatopsis endophytica]